MTLFQDTVGDPRGAHAHLADVLSWYGALGDAAIGNVPGFAIRKASIAVSLSEGAQLTQDDRDALYFAGLLHAIGAIGNAAYRKGEELSERIARMESWDVPAQGARICAAIGALPAACADMVRWQSEAWDGTGFPDQLRWHSIPLPAQLLGLANRFAVAGDPEEALGAIGLASGRAFGPDTARTFMTWFHQHGGEAPMLPLPAGALQPSDQSVESILDDIADRVDEHNGVAGRWRRVDALCAGAAGVLHLDAEAARSLAIACRLYGAGEIGAQIVEDEQFDPLARLGIDHRALHAEVAAELAHPYQALREGGEVVRLRAEWYDGTGKPRGLRNREIPDAAGILAAAIAYDRLDRKDRLDTAAGTQFDPKIVRALMESAKARA